MRNAEGGKMSEKNPNRIGALWYPQTENQNAPAAKGSIEIDGKTIKVVVWRNKWKQPGEKSPDLYIEIDQGSARKPGEPMQQHPVGNPSYGSKPASRQPEPVEPEFFDSVPF
jgi:hypothetical protein